MGNALTLNTHNPPSTRHDETEGDAPSVGFELGHIPIDDYRPMKVVVIGTGFSGITAGIRFRQHIEKLDLTIYEKNAGIGGTWYTNKYPGLACDIPAHCYQLTFEEKTDWSAFYAPGPEILSYLQGVVEKYKLMQYIKLQHELVHARYDEPTGKWHLRIRRPVVSSSNEREIQYEEFEDTADIFFTGFGALSRWKWPDIKGLDQYKGKLMHSAQWDLEGDTWQEGVKDWTDKKIAVIGVGSSGMQLVPALQPRVRKLVNYVRGKTWLSPPFASDKMAAMLGKDTNIEDYRFSPEDIERFKDPVVYREFRCELEAHLNSTHAVTVKGTQAQAEARDFFEKTMKERLAKKPWIADHLIPEFAVACRRLTPGPGYLEALCQDNVDFIPTEIKQMTENGIETMDGKVEEFDVIICATGYDTSYQYPFPMIGRNGVNIQNKWAPHPITYLAVCVDDFPNWFFSLGPNSGVGSGSLLAVIEHQVDYAVNATLKLQRERLKSIEVKPEAVADFDEYLEHYFPTSVYSEKCRSWYKMGLEEGRIVGLWPGSCLHALRALRHPRWEDFKYEKMDGVQNRFHWLGNGTTFNEQNETGETAWYLDPAYVNAPPVPTED
ncbi:FAD-binding Monooxygenase Superfamily protein [Abortiporus biennis]